MPTRCIPTRILPALMILLACEPAASDSLPFAQNSSAAVTAEAAQPKSKTDSSKTEDPFTPSSPDDFAGTWEAVSDDGTSTETAEFEISGTTATGSLRSLERGYYSGRVTVTADVAFRGTARAGGLDLRLWDATTGSPQTGVDGRALRRGPYLIVRIDDGESSYARRGESLIASAQGSAAAEAFARAIAGRIYSSSSQASGRGAFVGNRVRLALCSDGTIAFDVSDVATTGGSDAVDMGSSTSRRGSWDVVLLAGLPAVRAQWNGTGSSYSLTRYFRIRPGASGSSASVDGTELQTTGSC